MYTGGVIAAAWLAFDWFDRYVDAVQQFVAAKAALAPLLLLFVEESGVPLPVPGDVIIAYTGYRLATHPNSPALWEAFVAAQVSALAGATILFFVSRRWGQKVILRLGKFVFLREDHITRAERLFARYNILAIIIGRHIPGFRIPITVIAATSGVRYLTFIISTFVSTSAWILFYLLIGKRAGATFHAQIQHYVVLLLGVIAGIGLLIIALHFIGLYRESRRARQH